MSSPHSIPRANQTGMDNPRASAVFYRLTGLESEKHRHGTGPEHYATSGGTWTLELYPASAKFPASSSARAGFTVDSCDEVAGRLQGAGLFPELLPTDSPLGRRAVALAPDGHRVELTSPPNK